MVASAAQAQEAPTDPPAARIYALLNEARVSRGLNPLALNPELSGASLLHAQDMARRNYMEHENPEGETPRDRAARAGYSVPRGTGWLVIETISARATAESAMGWLMADRQHSSVLLHPRWREVGVGYVEGGPYGQFWVLNFGCRPNVFPVFARTGPAAVTVDLQLTNEECWPPGLGDSMGRATEMQISMAADFSGAAWEPFSSTKVLANPAPRVYVRLRDDEGRVSVSDAAVSGLMVAAGTPSSTETPQPTATSTTSPTATTQPSPTATDTKSPTPRATSRPR